MQMSVLDPVSHVTDVMVEVVPSKIVLTHFEVERMHERRCDKKEFLVKYATDTTSFPSCV